MLWYKPAVQTEPCHKVSLRDGREILVCIGGRGAEGFVSTELYVEDLLSPTETLMAGGDGDGTFFSVLDTSFACGQNPEGPDGSVQVPNPLVRAQIEKVEFLAAQTNEPPAVGVTASYGTKEMTLKDVMECSANPGKFLPSIKAYRLEFIFDGHGYQPAAASADSVRMIQAR